MSEFVIGRYQLQLVDSKGYAKVLEESEVIGSQDELNAWFANVSPNHKDKLKKGHQFLCFVETDPRFIVSETKLEEAPQPKDYPQSQESPELHELLAYEKERWLEQHRERFDLEQQFKSYMAAFSPSKKR
jgi:hypothetical protein